MARKRKSTEASPDVIPQQSSSRRIMRGARPLAGKVIGISVSQSRDIENYGYTSWDVNRVTVRLSEALLNAGARLVFGHDWRHDGIMAAICGLAIKSHVSDDENSGPLIQNFLAYPDQTSLPPERKRDLRRRELVHINQIEPVGVYTSQDSKLKRAVALSRMRYEMNKVIDARICIGGKRAGDDPDHPPSGFFPGVAEEAYWAAKTGTPLFATQFLGGVAAELIRTLDEESEQDKNANTRDSFVVTAGKEELHAQAIESIGDVKEGGFKLPPADLKSVFKIRKLNRATKNLWSESSVAVDVDSFAAIVRQLK